MRQRTGAALPALLFIAVVLGLSVLLLRVRPAAQAAPQTHLAAPVGDETASRLTPVLRPARLPAGGAADVRVALVRDPASARFHDDSTRYERTLDLWATAVGASGATVRLVAPAQLAADTIDVIVVPGAPCLSPATRAALLGAASRGRGVIFTGLTGTRDGGCRTIGFGLLASLTGASRADTLGAGVASFITLPSGSPLTFDVPPGARVELKPAPHVAVRHEARDGYYSDHDLNPLDSAHALLDGALVHEMGDGRRVAYLGFELETVVDRAWEQGIIALVLRNAIAFAAGVPLASPGAWPRGYDAAAVIAQDVEDEFRHARHAVDSLNAAGATGTFFLVSEIAVGHPALVDEMAAVGEIASHSENHRVFGGPVGVQRNRLNRTQEQLEMLTGQRVRGFRPPEERFDERTLAAWRQAGGTYLFGATNGRSASPELVMIDDSPFVLVGRTADDDFLAVRRAGITDPSRLAADQLSAFEKSRALGGLYIMSYHSNMMARPATAPAIGMVARALQAEERVWLTTLGDVAEWWLARHAAEVSVENLGDRLRLTMRNGAAQPLNASTVLLSMPRGARAIGTSSGSVLASSEGMARVPVPQLAAGETFGATITLARGTNAN